MKLQDIIELLQLLAEYNAVNRQMGTTTLQLQGLFRRFPIGDRVLIVAANLDHKRVLEDQIATAKRKSKHPHNMYYIVPLPALHRYLSQKGGARGSLVWDHFALDCFHKSIAHHLTDLSDALAIMKSSKL